MKIRIEDGEVEAAVIAAVEEKIPGYTVEKIEFVRVRGGGVYANATVEQTKLDTSSADQKVPAKK